MSIWWPASLPQSALRGRSRAPLPNVISFGTEVGPGKVRRRSTARVKAHAFSFLMTGAQVKIFEAFFENDLADGALSFRWNDPVAGTTGTWRFDTSAPYSETEVGPDQTQIDVKLNRIS